MLEPTKSVTVLPSTVRAANAASEDLCNDYFRGVEVVIDMTVVPGVDTVTFTVEGKDPTSGKYFTLLASTALSAQATTVLKIYPGLTASANAVASDVLPRTWRVRATHSAGSNFTYSVGANYLK
jgi:hypothetical protein